MNQEEGQLTKEEYDRAIAGINKVADNVSKMEWNYERLKNKREKLLLEIVVSYWKSIALKDDFLYPIRLTFSTYEYDCGMLNENLTKELLSLDSVISNGNNEIKSKRKEQVKRILDLQDKITHMHKKAVALSMFYRSCLKQTRYQALLQPESPTVEVPATPVPKEEPTITPVKEETTLKKQPSLQRKRSVHTIPVLSPEEFEARRSAMKNAVESETMEVEEDKKAARKAKKHARKVARRKEREEERRREEEKKKEEEMARKEEEMKKRMEEEKREEEMKKREEEMERKKREEEKRVEEMKKKEEEMKKREEEMERKKREEEEERKREEEEKRKEEEEKRKREEEEKRKEEEERKREEEEERREEEERKKEEEKRMEEEKRKEEEKKKIEEEEKRKEEEKKKKEEEEEKEEEKSDSDMDVESSDSEMDVDSKPEVTEADDLDNVKSTYSPRFEWMVKEGKLNLILLDVDFDQKSLRCITRPSTPTPKLILQGYRVVRRERPNGYYGMFYNNVPAYRYVPFTTVIPLPNVDVDLTHTPEALYYDDQNILQISYTLKKEKKENRIPVRRVDEEEDNDAHRPFYSDRRYPNAFRDPRFDDNTDDDDRYYSNPYYSNPYNPYRQRRYTNPRRSYSSPFDSLFGGSMW